MAVYIEGHAEGAVAATSEATAGVDKLAASTERLNLTQGTATKGFAAYATTTKSATKATEAHAKTTDKLGSVLKGAAASTVAFVGAYVGYEAIKDATTYTEELVHQTEILTRITGLDAKAASQWIELAKQRQLATSKVQIAFSTLSKQIRAAETGSTTAAKAFHALGIPLDELRHLNTEDVLLKISDGFEGMNDKAKRAALTSQFFGKSGRELLPVLSEGSKGLQDQLNKFEGLSASQEKAGQEAIEFQRKVSRAYDEIRVKVTFALLDAGKAIAGWVHQVEAGKTDVARTVRSIVSFFDHDLKDSLQSTGQFFKGFGQLVKGVCEFIQGVMHLEIGKAWKGVEDIFSGGVKETIAKFKGLNAPLLSIAGNIGEALGSAFGAAWTGIKTVFRDGANAVIGYVQDIADVINVIPGVPDIHLPTIGGGGGEAHSTAKGGLGKHKSAAAFARGGPINLGAPSGDTVPAMLERDEYVLNRNAVAAVGRPTLDALNFHIAPRLASGGLRGLAENAASVATSPLGVPKAILGGASSAINALHSVPGNLGMFTGLGSYVLSKVTDWIKSGFSSGSIGAPSAPSARGSYGEPALEQLWKSAKGPANLAHTAAAIAMAESGGNPKAHNPSGATGLWQILGSVVPGNLYDPVVNAKNAVAKWREGHDFDPWETFTNGSYRQYLAAGGPVKGTPGRAVAWASNNLGTQQGSAKQNKWAKITHGPSDPWCAEFVGADMLAQGLSLPPDAAGSSSYTNWSDGDVVGHSIGDAQPGDLLNFSGAHIAIYKGGGQMISGNFSDEVMETSWKAGPAPLSDVIRPHYQGAATSVKGAATGTAFTPKTGLSKAKGFSVPKLGTKMKAPKGRKAGLGAAHKAHLASGATATAGGGEEVSVADTSAAEAAAAEAQRQEEIKQLLEQQVSMEKERNAELQKTLNVSQSQYGVLAKAIADVASGVIGGKVGLGFQTPSVAGSLASY